jgi:hypothetical protein
MSSKLLHFGDVAFDASYRVLTERGNLPKANGCVIWVKLLSVTGCLAVH